LRFTMTDLDAPNFVHGGGSVVYDGQRLIPRGAFSYRGPCPPGGQHRYRWTVDTEDWPHPRDRYRHQEVPSRVMGARRLARHANRATDRVSRWWTTTRRPVPPHSRQRECADPMSAPRLRERPPSRQCTGVSGAPGGWAPRARWRKITTCTKSIPALSRQAGVTCQLAANLLAAVLS
jgi:hypothetical protein